MVKGLTSFACLAGLMPKKNALLYHGRMPSHAFSVLTLQAVAFFCTLIVHARMVYTRSHLGNSSTMNLDVEWNPLAVLDTPNPAQLPTLSEILCRPFEISKLPDETHTPVRVVGAKMLYAREEEMEVSTGSSHGEPSISIHQREQQLVQLLFLRVSRYISLHLTIVKIIVCSIIVTKRYILYADITIIW